MATCRWACLCASKNTHTHAYIYTYTHALFPSSSSTSQTHYWQQFSDGCVTASTADLLLERALPISAGLITLMYAHPDTWQSLSIYICSLSTPHYFWSEVCVCEVYRVCVWARECECSSGVREKMRRKQERNGSSRSLNVKQTNFNPTPSPCSSKTRRK